MNIIDNSRNGNIQPEIRYAYYNSEGARVTELRELPDHALRDMDRLFKNFTALDFHMCRVVVRPEEDLDAPR